MIKRFEFLQRLLADLENLLPNEPSVVNSAKFFEEQKASERIKKLKVLIKKIKIKLNLPVD